MGNSFGPELRSKRSAIYEETLLYTIDDRYITMDLAGDKIRAPMEQEVAYDLRAKGWGQRFGHLLENLVSIDASEFV